MKHIFHKELLTLIHYDPITGMWTRLKNSNGLGKKRDCVGYIMPEGYRRIKVKGRAYLSNVLAWFYMTGKWPPRIVDHKDNDKANDRWCNLRLATRRQNRVNSKCRNDNKSGFKGVHKLKNGKFKALLYIKNLQIYLGHFDSAKEANAAYMAAAKKKYGEFARGS